MTGVRAGLVRAALPALILLFANASPAFATPEFSERTAQSCGTCHLDGDGGELSRKGLEFAASGYVWPPSGGYRLLGPVRKKVRFFIGLFHIVAAFIWFGTILYVHLMLRPAYAMKGLPKGEVALGLVSMAVVGISGVLLTISRIRSLDVLVRSPWGIILSVKIALYLVMISSAAFVILVVGPRLKKGRTAGPLPADGLFGPEELSAFDGKEGRPALIAFNETVYDVSALKMWAGGMHMKHLAGTDLTDAIKRAPHGEEKLEVAKAAGTFNLETKPSLTPYQKAFYVVAYMNLTIVFIVLGTIAFWRWGFY
jgi:predicted heme/steroid binding protein